MQARPKLLYPLMVIAAIAVTVFSLLGIATLTGTLPLAHSEAGTASTASTASSIAKATQELLPESGTSSARRDRTVTSACRYCGVVESVSLVEMKGQGSGVGAIAGGVAGALVGNSIGQGNGRTAMTLLGGAGGAYAGNEIEKNTHKTSSYRIRVRMENGRLHTLYQRNPPAVAAGDHVKVVGSVIAQQSSSS